MVYEFLLFDLVFECLIKVKRVLISGLGVV